MTTVYVYNRDVDRVEKFEKNNNEIMPYVYNRCLTVGEFKGSSSSNVIWTNRKTMENWSRFREIIGKPIDTIHTFKRIWEGGHSNQSQHYAGTAFDLGQDFTTTERSSLRNTAINSGLWNYVETANLTPSWVHADNRDKDSACTTGYPTLTEGKKGNYVFVLQDALNALGYKTGLNGSFEKNTKAAVINFQKEKGLPADGIVECLTWTALTQQAMGIGRTATVVKP